MYLINTEDNRRDDDIGSLNSRLLKKQQLGHTKNEMGNKVLQNRTVNICAYPHNVRQLRKKLINSHTNKSFMKRTCLSMIKYNSTIGTR